MKVPLWFRHWVLEWRSTDDTVFAFKHDDNGGWYTECLQCGYVGMRARGTPKV